MLDDDTKCFNYGQFAGGFGCLLSNIINNAVLINEHTPMQLLVGYLLEACDLAWGDV